MDVTTMTEGVGVVVAPGVVDGVCVMVAVTSTTLGVGVVDGGTTVVESGIDVTEVIVVGGVEVVSGVDVEAVTVTVVENEVVKLVEVVPIVVTTTESVNTVLVSVDMVTRVSRFDQERGMLAGARR